MKTFLVLSLTVIFFRFIASDKLYANVEKKNVEKKLVLSKQGVIWAIEFINNDTIVFSERSGKLKLFNLKSRKLTELKGLPVVYAKGQGGLLDVKKHPNFSINKQIYLTYSKKEKNKITTALGRVKLDGFKLKDFKEIFIARAFEDSQVHFGSRITFDENNNIFMTVGERGERSKAQNLNTHHGKILKMTDQGKALNDTPFIDSKAPYIWSYGHRNPQGLFYDKELKTLYAIEHGPRGGDEINVISKGKNYGWPLQSYGKEYMLPIQVGKSKVKGIESPIKYYIPSIAPSGLVLYKGERYPTLQNSLISGSLKQTHINVFHLDQKKEIRLFDDIKERIRSLALSDDDYLYFGTDSGNIYKVLPSKK